MKAQESCAIPVPGFTSASVAASGLDSSHRNSAHQPSPTWPDCRGFVYKSLAILANRRPRSPRRASAPAQPGRARRTRERRRLLRVHPTSAPTTSPAPSADGCSGSWSVAPADGSFHSFFRGTYGPRARRSGRAERTDRTLQCGSSRSAVGRHLTGDPPIGIHQ